MAELKKLENQQQNEAKIGRQKEIIQHIPDIIELNRQKKKN